MRWWLLLASALLLPVSTSAAELSVAGNVRSADSKALSGARAELVPLPSNFEWNRLIIEEGRIAPEPVAKATPDPHGRFQLAVPRPGVYRVVVSAEGRVPMRYFPLAVADSVELPPVALLPAEMIEIEVRDGGGAPAVGAWVMATSPDAAFWQDKAENGWRTEARISRTDDRGLLRLPRASGERLELHAFPAASVTVVSAIADGPRASIRLPGEHAAETVFELTGPTQEPVAGVRLALGQLAWPAGATDAAGRLALRGVSPLKTLLHLFAADGQRDTIEVIPSADGRRLHAQLSWRRRAMLTGRVIAATDRRPLAGVLVWPGHDPGTATFTDAQGRYQLAALPEERFWVQANVAGFLPGLEHVDTTSGSTTRVPTIALQPAATAGGMVVDNEGRPVSGARLEARAKTGARLPPAFRPDRAASRAETDPAGRFSLTGLLAGASYELSAEHAGFATSHTSLDPVPPKAPLRIVLAPARQGHGRVLDTAENPLAEATVTLVTTGGAGGEPVRVKTDAEGGFAVDALPLPRVDVEVRKQGYAPLRVRGIEIAAGDGPVDLGSFVLALGERLSGTVKDTAGEPIAEVGVWKVEDRGQTSLPPGSSMRGEPAVLTDARGRFVIEDLAAGERWHLLFGRDGFLPESVVGIEVPYPRPIAVVLHPAAKIGGRVIEESGEAIAGATVSLSAADPPPGTVGAPRGRQSSLSATTQSDGTFTLEGVAPGPIQLEASARGFLEAAPLRLEARVAEPVEDLEIVLRRGASVAGRIVTTAGEPVEEARLRCGAARATSDTDGFYQLDGVAPGQVELELRHPRYERVVRTLEVAPGLNTFDVVLDAGWSVSGRVLDTEGTAVEGATVVLGFDGRWGRREYQAASAAEGKFLLTEVADGRYRVSVAKPGFAETESDREVAVAGAAVEGLELRLTRAATLHGRLVGLDFEELARVAVSAESAGKPERTGVVDYEGGYEITSLGPGDWRVRAQLRGGRRSAEALVAIEPGVRVVERDLEFGGGVVLTGRVTLGGEPLPGTRVSLTAFEQAVERSVTTDLAGAFRFEDLSAGRYRLSATNPRQQLSHSQYLELTGDLDLPIDIATAHLGGQVVDALSTEPIAGASVFAQALLGADATDPGPMIGVMASESGAFTFARLSAGHYRIAAQKDGFAPAETTVALAPGDTIEGLELQLVPASGFDLVVRLASGAVPPSAVVGVYDASGQLLLTEGRFLDPDGHARFTNIPAGTWSLAVSAPGGVTVRVSVSVPGEPVALVLPPATRLRVRVPALVDTNRTGTLTLTTPDGRPFESLASAATLQRQWLLSGGVATIESVPPGAWVVHVAGSDGQLWELPIVLGGEPEVELRLE